MRAFLIGWGVAAALGVGTIWLAHVTDKGVAFAIGLAFGIVCPSLAMWVSVRHG